MKINDFIPGNAENEFLASLKDATQKTSTYTTLTPAQQKLFSTIDERSAAIGRIHRLAPHLEPGVVMALADTGANDSMIAKIGLAAINIEKEKAEQEQAENRSGNGNWLYGKFKTGIRWATAGGETAWQLLFNTPASNILQPTGVEGVGEYWKLDLQNPFRKGWWASTPLGTLQMQDTEAGSGFFIGGKAGQDRERRLMDYVGRIPLTVEAGASENTQFEATPEQLHTVAMQILAQKDISYEEALDEANRIIRSNAFMAATTVNVLPYAQPTLLAGLPLKNPIEFSDVGSKEYAVASAVATLASAVAVPDPTFSAFKGLKSGIAYARGINYVDDAGNLLYDTRAIAQNVDEARFMADVDHLVVLANDFEVSALNSLDEAVEFATPQEGVRFHGSRTGPIPGNNIVDITDPRYPTPEGNILGPGFYTTDQPTIGQAYARRPGATEPITAEEQALLRQIPGAVGDPQLQIALPETGLNVPPAAVYRFVDNPEVKPRLLDANRGLAESVDGPAQATPEEIDKIARWFIDPDKAGTNKLQAAVQVDDALTQIIDKMDLNTELRTIFEQVRDSIANVPMIAKSGGPSRKWFEFNFGLGGGTDEILNQKWIQAITENPDLVEQIKYVPPSVSARRIAFTVNDFYQAQGRAPQSIEELLSFAGAKSVDEFLFAPGEDSVAFFKQSSLNMVLGQTLYSPEEIGMILDARLKSVRELNTMFGQLPDELRDVNRVLTREKIIDSLSSADDFPAVRTQLDDIYSQLFDVVTRRQRASVAEAFTAAGLSQQEITSFIEFNRGFGVVATRSKGMFYPGNVSFIPALKVNTFLKNEMGFDGFEHVGRLSQQQGAEATHRVKIFFDPAKHLDITDPLTGERLPINEAIAKMRESGELAERAGEIRLQIDELKTQREAGLLPGYGPVVDPTTFKTFFTQSRAGRFAADRIWKVVEKFDGSSVEQNRQAWYELWTMFKGRIPLEDMDEILKATSKEELIGIINKKVGVTTGLSNLDDINFSLSKTLTKAKEVSRMDVLLDKADEFYGPIMSRSPKSKHLNIFGSDREKLQALKDLDAFLKTGVRGDVNKLGKSVDGINREREMIVARFAEAMMSGDRNALFNVARQLESAINWRALVETGDEAQAQFQSDIWRRAFDQATGSGLYQVGEEGMRIDNGYAAALAEDGNTYLHGMVHGGPGLLSELLRSPLELPDIQELRRVTSWLGILTSKQGFQRAIKKSELRTKALQQFGVDLTEKDLLKLGELRVPLRVIDFAMNKVWKQSKKFSLAYGLRNTMEAQARLAFADKENIFSHPIDHILVSTHAKIPDDILLGEEFNPGGWKELGKIHETAGNGYQTFLNNLYYGSDQVQDMVYSQFRNNEFVVYSKDNPIDWGRAGGYELRQLFNDEIARRFARGASLDEIMTWLYSGTDEAKQALDEIQNVMRNGEVFYGAGGTKQIVPVEPTPANVRLRVETQQLARLNLKTGGDPNLMEVVSRGKFRNEDAFLPDGNPSPKLVEYLVENIDSESLPNFYKGRGASAGMIQAKLSWWEQLTKTFFDSFMGRAHNTLDRSPLWRREYSKEVTRLAPLMSKEAAAEVKQIFIERVAHYDKIAKAKKLPRKFTLQDYVGRNVDVDDLMNSLDNANGWMSREELHVLANGLTLDKIENLLFDATKRNSITDAARVVSPFGAAFAEVLSKWVVLTASRPDKVVKLNRAFSIATGEDKPEGMKNRGIIHKDPVTGQYFYSLPMSRQVASLFNRIVGEETGAEYQLQAPVKGLNMAFNFTPGFSPVAGFPLGKLLYGSPQLRDYATLFMPYGPSKSPTDIMEYLPGWASKIVNAIQGDSKRAGVYGDTLSDVIRAEITTGKWDLSNPDERSQFYRDAETKAKVLTMLRGFGQLIGPASPTIEAKVRTQSGDIMAGHLTSEFHKLQEEDYNTAVERFLAMFGDEAFAYMAGKTKQVMSGVEASREFAKWELDNADLFDTPFAPIAGYFGPKGSDFDWAAWSYQTSTGKREFVPPIPTQVEMAEQIIGLHKYRQLVKAAGPNPNENVRAVLLREKTKLEKEYPGMASLSTYDVEKFPRTLKQLRLATQDPRLKNNTTAMALEMYLNLRDVYVTGAKTMNIGWDSQRSAGLKADLRYRAQLIIEQTPEFGRLFERLLLPELEK